MQWRIARCQGARAIARPAWAPLRATRRPLRVGRGVAGGGGARSAVDIPKAVRSPCNFPHGGSQRLRGPLRSWGRVLQRWCHGGGVGRPVRGGCAQRKWRGTLGRARPASRRQLARPAGPASHQPQIKNEEQPAPRAPPAAGSEQERAPRTRLRGRAHRPQ